MDNQYISQIEKIQFSVFRNKDVLNYSVVKVEHPEAYENGMPKKNGIVDSNLGTTDNNRICSKCGEGLLTCPGHFGHTVLHEPVFNYTLKEQIKNVLSCVCLRCSKLLLSKSTKDIGELMQHKKNKSRFNLIKKLPKPQRCQNVDNQNNACNAEVTKIRTSPLNGYWNLISEENASKDEAGTVQDKKKNKTVLTASMVHAIFVNISDADWILMGFEPSKGRPEDWIIKNFAIPPLAIRPTIKQDSLVSMSSEDTLQNKISEIIKNNINIEKNKTKGNVTEAELKTKNDLVNILQYSVSSFQVNDTNLPTSLSKGTNRPAKSVSERLKGKTGRIRFNIMGKRTNFSARTVITSNPNLSLFELGVPKTIAMNVPFRETVNEYNFDQLSIAVRNGRDIHPGANYVIKNNGPTYDLRIVKTINLEYGDIVERHLIDGDLVLFNRQPTLHKGSAMSHKIKVLNGETYRLNVSATEPYNADKLFQVLLGNSLA